MMSSSSDAEHFRFLDLPAELRNEVYKYAFADTHDASKISLRTFRQKLPKPCLTQVSKQVRGEVLQLHEKACGEFFATHTIQMALPWNNDFLTVSELEEETKDECDKLLDCPGFKIHNLAVRLLLPLAFNLPPRARPDYADLDVYIESTNERRQTYFYCQVTGVDRRAHPGHAHQIENALGTQLVNVAIDAARTLGRGPSLIMENGGLDMESCIHMLFLLGEPRY